MLGRSGGRRTMGLAGRAHSPVAAPTATWEPGTGRPQPGFHGTGSDGGSGTGATGRTIDQAGPTGGRDPAGPLGAAGSLGPQASEPVDGRPMLAVLTGPPAAIGPPDRFEADQPSTTVPPGSRPPPKPGREADLFLKTGHQYPVDPEKLVGPTPPFELAKTLGS